MVIACPPVVLAGHSHAHALGMPKALDAAGARTVPARRTPDGWLAICGNEPRSAGYREQLIAAAASGHVPAILWGGNQHYAQFLFAPTPAFDVMLSHAPELPIDPQAVLVPEALVRACFEPEMAGLRDMLEGLGGRRALVIGTPPPKNAQRKVRERLTAERYFVDRAAQLGADLATIALTEPRLLLKLWCVIQNLLRETAETAGAQFVPVPDRVRTPDGYLQARYWGRDVTHANPDYGAAMVQEIIAALTRPTSGHAN